MNHDVVIIETTATCPMGLVAAIAAEHLGVRYEPTIRPDGYFIAHHGGPGPRVTIGSETHLGAAAVCALVERCLDASGAGRATRIVFDEMRRRVGPALAAAARADVAARPQVMARLDAVLGVLDILVNMAPRADWEAGVMVPVLAPLARLFAQPHRRDAFPDLARSLDHVAGSLTMERARSRLAAAPRVVAPEEVLAFWFGAPIVSADEALERARRWFMGGAAMDEEVRARFLPTIEAALRGELDGWASTARGRLALVIVLDQLTRNAFRGTSAAWSGDARALACCKDALDCGSDAELDWLERMFLTMPLVHSEDRVMVGRAIDLARRAACTAPPALAWMAGAAVEQAEKYDAILARFGRYPFRNEPLGRASTAEEEVFLLTFPSTAPPKAMRA